MKNLILLLMASIHGTSCGNRYKACSAALPGHPVWALLWSLFKEEPKEEDR
jgi:hypothetical protein